jgi:hypothetical protein
MHSIPCECGKNLTILNTVVKLSGPQASLKFSMRPALSERLKTPALIHQARSAAVVDQSGDSSSINPDPRNLLFIYILFTDSVSSSENMTPSVGMVSE